MSTESMGAGIPELRPRQDRPYLHVPVETKVREFDAKLLLSCYAAEAGFNVILGDQVELRRKSRYLPSGLYLAKGVSTAVLPQFRKLSQEGFRVVAWCEEGLVILDPEAYANGRVSLEAMSLTEQFFAWGKIQADAICKRDETISQKMKLTGNPRFDLLREPYRRIFDSQVAALKDEWGDFLLVNTNFKRYNSFLGHDYFLSLNRTLGDLRGADHEAFLRGWLEYDKAVFHEFVAMVRFLADKFPQLRTIVRPHPSENHDRWRELVGDLDNVAVVHEGNAASWIMASSVTIHHSCTTGVEARVLETPVVAYDPQPSDLYEPELPRLVSLKAATLNELHDAVADALKAGPAAQGPAASEPVLASGEYVCGLSGPYSCERVVDALVELAPRLNIAAGPRLGSAASLVASGAESAIYAIKVELNRLLKGGSRNFEYARQKFPGLELSEMTAAIRRISEVSGRFDDVKVTRVGSTRSCFLLQR